MESHESEFVFVNRTVGVPVRPADAPEMRTAAADDSFSPPESAAAVPEDNPPVPAVSAVRPRRALSGETRLLLVQIAAALLLAAAVALGLRLGGESFRARYQDWIGYRSIDLNAWLTPIVPDSSVAESSNPDSSVPDSSVSDSSVPDSSEPPTDAASAG